MDPTRLFLLILSSCFAVNLAGAQGALNGSGLSNITETALDDVTLDDEKPCHEGQIINHGCDEVCNCQNGQLQCWPRCTGPLVKSSLGSQDPHCHLKAEDECCSTLICSHSKIKDGSVEYCEYGNQTYNIGETFQMGCISICKCAPGGNVECKPRCPPTNNTNSDSDRCLTVADKKDPCCKILYCDVNESDDIGLEEEEEEDHERNLVSAIPANNSAVILNFDSPLVPDDIKVEISQDNVSWVPTKASGHVVQDLIPGKTYYFRVVARSGYSNVVSSTLPKISSNSSDCEYKGKKYKKGVEFHDDCSAYCICAEEGVECAPFKCPTYFGLDVLDPQCLKWETRPADFKPEPPRCCPDSVVCVNNGSCLYKGEMFENWADIPTKLSGCDMKCYCQAGNVTCSPRCPPVPAAPPQHIHCPLNAVPIVSHPPDDNCCLNWMCPSSNGVPQPPTPGFPSHPQEKNAITVHTVEAVDENTVRLVFSVPMILVGLHGRVELRYTADNKNSDPATWEQQVLAPPDDLIATPELEFKLENLQPDTEYKIKITVVMRDLQNSPASQILTVKTPPTSQASPPVIPVDPELHVVSSNSTSATVSWRKFTERELHFIDGVQLRYKEIEGKVYQATPLIHRAVTSYTIEDLKPESQYEVGILLIPFPGQTTELQAQKTVHLSTSIENDPYKFELTLDVHHIKSTSVEVTWSGVPYPEDKYVNIFRAIYQYDAGREDMNAFKVAKRDSPAGTLIQGLKPDTRYRLWIEAYLTNGKIKKSNVKDFITKKGHGAALNPNQGKLESSSMAEGNDYYGPLVGVSILAAIAILAAAGLLVVLAKKHGHNKAPITTAVQRKSLPHTAAYDNPSYKVEMQHETMEL